MKINFFTNEDFIYKKSYILNLHNINIAFLEFKIQASKEFSQIQK